MSFNYEYHTRSGFELFSYNFRVTEKVEDYGDPEKIKATHDEMERILSMANFTREPTMSKEDLIMRLNGQWSAGDSGSLVFEDEKINWYKDDSLSDDNVIDIQLSTIEPIIHPEENREYGYLEIDYLSQGIEGETHPGDQHINYFVHFMSDNKIRLISMTDATQFQLKRVSE